MTWKQPIGRSIASTNLFCGFLAGAGVERPKILTTTSEFVTEHIAAP